MLQSVTQDLCRSANKNKHGCDEVCDGGVSRAEEALGGTLNKYHWDHEQVDRGGCRCWASEPEIIFIQHSLSVYCS